MFAVSSASLVLARLAPGDFATESLGVEAHREIVAEPARATGSTGPIGAQYGDWLACRAARFRPLAAVRRPVSDLVPERAANTAVLALTALVLATLIGLPLGVVTGSRRGGVLSTSVRAVSLVLLSMPPLLTSLFLIFVAARTGWLPIAGMRSADAPGSGVTVDLLRHLIVPAAALALPMAAMFERLQSQAMADNDQRALHVRPPCPRRSAGRASSGATR